MSEILFDHEAASWTEALPLGNGTLGAMVFGGVAHERIQLNEDSCWSGGPMDRVNNDCLPHLAEVRRLLFEGKPEEAEALAAQTMYGTYPHMRHYQTLGDIWIDLPELEGKRRVEKDGNGLSAIETQATYVEDYVRRLDLAQALQTLSFRHEGTTQTREAFVSFPAQALVFRIAQDTPFSATISATRKDNNPGRGSSYCDGCRVLDDGATISLWGTNGGADGIRFAFCVRVLTDGHLIRGGSHLVVDHSKELILLVAARTSFRSNDPLEWCLGTLAAAERKGMATLRAEHIADYQKLFSRCQLSLSGTDSSSSFTTAERLGHLRHGKEDLGLVETYFDYGRYLLISSSREGSLPANLQGIWCDQFEPAWGSKYTVNINLQMNYWMAESLGLSELTQPLFDQLLRMLPKGEDVARRMYGTDGFCCHHNTDIWGDCAPQDAHATSTIWPMGAAWLALHVVEHWRYTHDEKFLATYFCIVEEAARFLAGYLVEDPDGYLVTGPSVSPENAYLTPEGEIGSLCMGPTMDTEIVQELFSGYLELAEQAAADPYLVETLAVELSHLRPLEIGRHGQIVEWSHDFEETEPGHRHISQLFALCPGTAIRPEKTPDLAAAAERTLERRLSHGGGHTGWSKAWIDLLFARLHRGEDAWGNFCGLLSNSTQENLLDSHPPFQIDGNFGGCAALAEMLVQDFEDEVLLLPALPKALPSGSLEGVSLKCGGSLRMKWIGGHLVEAEIEAVRDSIVSITIFPEQTVRRISIAAGKTTRVVP